MVCRCEYGRGEIRGRCGCGWDGWGGALECSGVGRDRNGVEGVGRGGIGRDGEGRDMVGRAAIDPPPALFAAWQLAPHSAPRARRHAHPRLLLAAASSQHQPSPPSSEGLALRSAPSQPTLLSPSPAPPPPAGAQGTAGALPGSAVTAESAGDSPGQLSALRPPPRGWIQRGGASVHVCMCVRVHVGVWLGVHALARARVGTGAGAYAYS